MTDRDRSQIYLDMSKQAIEAYVIENGGTEKDALRVWNMKFNEIARKMGVEVD